MMPLKTRSFALAALLLISLTMPIQLIKAIPSYGQVVYYNFESISGVDVSDLSGNGKTAQLVGNVTVEDGKDGKAVRLTGVNDCVLLPQGILNNITNFTLSTWVNLSSTATWSRIFDFGSGTDEYMFLTPMSGNGTPRFAIKPFTGGEQIIDANVNIPTNTWTHVAITFTWDTNLKQGVGKFYINGEQVGINQSITVSPAMLASTTQNYLGKSQWPDPGLNGLIDEFVLYYRPLSETEIMECYGFTAEMVAAYNSLTLTGDLTNVTDNLTLPTVTGTNSFPVSWDSSLPEVVATDGTVNRLEVYDKDVLLTATITITGGITVKKMFAVIVLAKAAKQWRSLVLESDTFSYLAAKSEPPADWYQPTFNASTWLKGMGGFGYADNDDNTVVSVCNSIYLRRQFTVNDVSELDRLVLDIDYDDAYVVYLNGQPVANSNNISGPYQPYNGRVSTDREAQLYKGGSPERTVLNTSMLVNGTNTLAVHVLNLNLSSTDLSARVFLHTRVKASGNPYQPVPSWFMEPVDLGVSELPLIMLNTGGQSIGQAEKIMVDMTVLNSPTGFNALTDTIYEYNGKVGIKIRGNSSAGFAKKSYTVETWDELGEDLNVSLLGMPKENDWVFHGPYPDKSLMRNVLAYHLGNLTGTWSPRTRFFELYLNGNHQGVYVLVEKIKVDKNRLDLAKLKPEEASGDQITGGYIMKLDRPESTDVNGIHYWISPYKTPEKKYNVNFIHHYPDGDDLNLEQRTYARQHFTAFEDAVYSNEYTDSGKGYYQYVDFQSFVDYYILTELSRNLDGYRISTFLHKDKDSKGGKIKMGPYWDYDISFGNANFFQAGNTAGWVVEGMDGGDDYAMPFWWDKFRLDPYFNSELKKSWNRWTNKYLNASYLGQFIDSCATVIYDAQKRNFQTWNILNTYLWPNNYVGGTYANEINYLKTWLNDRISWMDSQIQVLEELPTNVTAPTLPMDLITTPNPFTSEVTFRYNLGTASKVRIAIYDMMGRVVYNHEMAATAGIQEHQISADELGGNASVYLYKVSVNGAVRKTGKLILER
ncbi:MAG: T9SS type A sorting domain-containing protein [Bacteroidales bacterium]|nr:T9SS type A sorting domain-containing protein [Bacteroidales bacterium]